MNTLVQLSPILLMLIIFYFLLIRPQQKRQRQIRDMQSALKKGDEIVTIGGLHGVIDSIDEDQIVISCHNSKLTFDRGAVREVKSEDE